MVQCDATFASAFTLGSQGWRTYAVQVDVQLRKRIKKLRYTVRNKARIDGCIAEAFTCKEITNISSKYFSCANNVNAHMPRYHIVKEVPLSELSIFQWKGKGVGAPSAHYITDKEWNYSMLYMYTNMEEVQPYFKMFDKTYWK